MRTTLVFALDRAGCLQTARWSIPSSRQPRQRSQSEHLIAHSVPEPDKGPEICSDTGLSQIPLCGTAKVRTGSELSENNLSRD